MPFEPGHKKLPNSGRKKGQVNKNKQDLNALADLMGVNPIEILLNFAKGDWKALGYENKERVIGYTKHGDPITTKRHPLGYLGFLPFSPSGISSM